MGMTSTQAATARSTPASQLVLNHAIATIAKTIDERILALPGSRDRLLPAIQHAITYYQHAIAAIPGPIRVSASLHGSEPMLAAMFPAPEDVTVGLGRSIAVRNSINWFVENRHERVFAIMGTRLRPGSASTGLTDHTFRSLAASEQDARECLCEAAVTSLVSAFASRLKEREREWRQLHSAGSELTTEAALKALIEWLRAPEAQFRLSAKEGQMAALAASGSRMVLPLLSGSDRRHWLVCLAEFSLQEALGAIGTTPAANRYILI